MQADLSLLDYIIVVVAGRWVIFASLRAAGISHPAWYGKTLFLIPWRPFMAVWYGFTRWRDQFRHGQGATAALATYTATLMNPYRRGQTILGYTLPFGLRGEQPVGEDNPRHALIIGQTGSAKTVTAIANQALHDGPILMVSPKQDMEVALGAKLAHSGRFYRLRPLNANPADPTASWNPFYELDWIEKNIGAYAVPMFASMAMHSLITTPVGSKNPFFTDAARSWGLAGMLHVHTSELLENRTLLYWRQLMIRGYAEAGEDAFDFLLDKMQRNSAFDGQVATEGAAMSQLSERERGSIIKTLETETKFIDFVGASTTRHDFYLNDLLRSNASVSLTAASSDYQGTLRGFNKLFIEWFFYLAEQTGGAGKPCAITIDELAAIGRLPTVERILPLARSLNLLVTGIVQSIPLLRAAYPDTWEAFISEAGIVWWCGTACPTTSQYLSTYLGQRVHTSTVKAPSSGNPFAKHLPDRVDQRETPVLDAEQIRRTLGNTIIVTRGAGKRAMRLAPPRYHSTLPVWLYDDRGYRDRTLRALSRSALVSTEGAATPTGAVRRASP